MRDGLQELANELRKRTEHVYAMRVQAVVDGWDTAAKNTITLRSDLDVRSELDVVSAEIVACPHCGVYNAKGALQCSTCGKATSLDQGAGYARASATFPGGAQVPAATAAVVEAEGRAAVATAVLQAVEAGPPAPTRPCEACRQQLFFLPIQKKDGSLGSATPIEWPPVPHAGHLLVVPHDSGAMAVRNTTKAEQPVLWASGKVLYTGHFGRCPEAERFRRR